MKRSLCALCVLAMLIAGLPLYSQLNRGTITGSVTDASGSAIPKVNIMVRETTRGAVQETVSNEVGQYNVPNLPIGAYEISFEAPGFKRLVRGAVTLGTTEVLRVDAALEVGDVSQSTSVTAEVPRLQTDNPDVSTSLGSRSLLQLPLTVSGGRNAEEFAYKISPGLGGDSNRSYINGSLSFSKETLLDGATVTTNRQGHYAESSVSVEAVQEVKIQTSGMSAEFGRTQGGVFNYTLKSGTNQVHGSAFGALRNEAFNANTFIDNANGRKRALDRKWDYAGSFGGTVYMPKIYDGRNRTFFYVAWEQYKERTWGIGPASRTVPLPEFYDGDFSRLLGPVLPTTDALGRPVVQGAIYDPATFRQLDNGRWVGDIFPGNKIPVNRFSEVSKRLNAIARKYYLPAVRDASGQIPLTNNSNFILSGTPELDQKQFSLKLDQMVTRNHRLSGSVARTTRPRLSTTNNNAWAWGEEFGGPLSGAQVQKLDSRYARMAHDWTISPTVLNYFTVYVNRFPNPIYNLNRDLDGARELGLKGISTDGYPVVNWGGGPFVTLGNVGLTVNQFQAFTTSGLLETVSFSRGSHFMKAGFDFRRTQSNNRQASGGQFNFDARATAIPNEAFSGRNTGYSFASYLLGIVDSASLSDPISIGGRIGYYALFVQDDWKVGRTLTLNAGLRWDYSPPFHEANDRLSSWNPNKIDPASGLPGAYDFAGKCDICTGRSYFGMKDWNNFGPRFGFAWRPLDKWTVRGGYGILYEGQIASSPGKAQSVAWGGTYELGSNPVQPWQGIFNWDTGSPANFYRPASFDLSWGNRNRPSMYDPEFGRSPYIQQWNLNIQHELAKNLVLDIGYVANKATALRAGEKKRLNQLQPSLLQEYGRNLNNQVRNPAEAAANNVRYPYPGFAGTVAGALRPYPQVRAVDTINVNGAPLGFSNYNSLQIVLNKQFSGGFTVYSNYVWSKSISNEQSSNEGDNTGPLDYYNLALEKSVSFQDRPHMFKTYVDYELPFGRGKAFLNGPKAFVNGVFSGWSISAILNYSSGIPLTFTGSSPLSAWNGATFRADVAAGDMLNREFDQKKFELSTLRSPNNTYLNKRLFSDPLPLALGNSAPRYTQARELPALNEDFGLQKFHRFGEKYRMQIRAEFLNAFNRHRLAGIETSVTNPNFGQVTGVSGNRTIQLGARVDF